MDAETAVTSTKFLENAVAQMIMIVIKIKDAKCNLLDVSTDLPVTGMKTFSLRAPFVKAHYMPAIENYNCHRSPHHTYQHGFDIKIII